jgi:hypothetical protein
LKYFVGAIPILQNVFIIQVPAGSDCHSIILIDVLDCWYRKRVPGCMVAQGVDGNRVPAEDMGEDISDRSSRIDFLGSRNFR